MSTAGSSSSITDRDQAAMVLRGSPSSGRLRTACGASTSFVANRSCSKLRNHGGDGRLHPSPHRLWRSPSGSRRSRICRMFNRAIAKQTPPKYLSSDNDPLFRFHRWRANLRLLEVDEIKTLPCTPLSHPFVERPIGTVRRKYLDRTLFWNREDLKRKLAKYQAYSNQRRCHTWLAGATPAERSGPTRTADRYTCVIYLATALQRLISDPNSRLNWNSKQTAPIGERSPEP
jgi:hypothetical protein